MSLRINTFIGKIPKIIFWLVIAFLAGCLIKVIIWEHNYYNEKNGSERAQMVQVGASSSIQEEEVDETEVTEEERVAHTVAADRPRYLTIQKFGIYNARVKDVGLTATGAFATLANIFDVAWFNSSSKPGHGGTLLLNGHNGGPTKIGIFKYLDQLAVGETIVIERGDGRKFYYEVVENKTMLLADANKYMSTMQKSPIAGRESVSIITCTGGWVQSDRTYDSRVMLRAVLVKEE